MRHYGCLLLILLAVNILNRKSLTRLRMSERELRTIIMAFKTADAVSVCNFRWCYPSIVSAYEKKVKSARIIWTERVHAIPRPKGHHIDQK